MLEALWDLLNEFVGWVDERFSRGAAWLTAVLGILGFFALFVLIFWFLAR